ncbi:ATP-binding protein [Spirosoma migulaei]
MIQREIETTLVDQLHFQPAVALLGPRQVGKTTLAKEIQTRFDKPTVYFDLESSQDWQKFQQDSRLFLERLRDQTVILDEIQRLPNLFPDLRGLIDEHRVPGRFILLGSASPELLKNTSESLAGRISYLEMAPFFLRELATDDYVTHWLRGGFPKSYLASTLAEQQNWFENFVRTYVERDLPQLGLRAEPILMRRLLTMIASMQSGLLNQSMLANSLGIRNTAVSSYLDFLEQAFLIRRLAPYFTNIGKRLTKSPKIYIRDSGMLHHLLRIYDEPTLLGHYVAGGSWEGYVLEQIISLLDFHHLPFFYRTADGAELDLVIESGLQIKLAVEIKLSNAPQLTKGTTVALQDLGNPPLLVVTPSAGDYIMRENTYVCSVQTLPEQLRQFGLLSG